MSDLPLVRTSLMPAMISSLAASNSATPPFRGQIGHHKNDNPATFCVCGKISVDKSKNRFINENIQTRLRVKQDVRAFRSRIRRNELHSHQKFFQHFHDAYGMSEQGCNGAHFLPPECFYSPAENPVRHPRSHITLKVF
jgi:hypothetical protein